MYLKRSHTHKIVILNPKGGSGKTTLAINLASYFALRGPMPALVDYDPQGFATEWLRRRPMDRPVIHGIFPRKPSMHSTRSWQMRMPAETETVIVDTPAALNGTELHDLTYDANCIIVPIMPSAIDIRFAARFIADLLLMAQIERHKQTLAIVANRTRQNTRSLKQLWRFLNSLRIPVIAILQDSQNFIHSADAGIGIHEMRGRQVSSDREEMNRIVRWIEYKRLQSASMDNPVRIMSGAEPPGRALH